MKKNKKIWLFAATAIVCALFLGACVFLDSFNVDQPQDDGTMAPKIKINEVATFTVNGHIEVAGDRNNADELVFAMLAPRGWDIRNNTVVTYRATEALNWADVQNMVPISASAAPRNMPGYTWPEALMERFGLGPNRFNDMEWVAWKAAEPVQVFNGSRAKFEITVKVKVGKENLSCALGLFINDIEDGLTTDGRYFKCVFSDPFTVYGGKNEPIDYSRLNFNTVEPSRALQDDLISIKFSGDAYENDLVKCNEIFFNGTAYTAEGHSYTVDRRDPSTLMARESNFSHDYSITLWPAGFFNVPDDETITHIDYHFTNGDGTVVVNKALNEVRAGSVPASPDLPFTFNLMCGN